MPRKPRLHVPGGIYHLILRGDNHQPFFFSHSNRLDFESLVEGGVARDARRVHAYCWMTSRLHLAILSIIPVGNRFKSDQVSK